MTDNPYKTPKASVEISSPEPVPDAAVAKKIRNAWLAGLISAGVTVLFILISMFGGTAIAGIDVWAFADVAIILGLSYGVYRKSRACAVILLLFFVGNKLVMWTAAGTVSGLPVALVFMWFFGQGVVGTYQYHKARAAGEAAAG